MTKRSCFTLAEVLITLGIIGVVAIMTISVIQSIVFDAEQKADYKKAYAILYSVILKVKNDAGYQMDCYYPTSGGNAIKTECTEFYAQLATELSVIKFCLNNAYSGGCVADYRGIDTVIPAQSAGTITSYSGFNESNIKISNPAYVLADGMILFPYGYGVNNVFPIFAIDINGQNKPNKWGYDIFIFKISSNLDLTKLIFSGTSWPETGGKTDAQMFQDAFK